MNKYQKEYLGKELEIIQTNNKQQQGLKGLIVDETKYAFVVKNKKERTILKKDNKFLIDQDIIEGNKILKRPEDRVKIKK